MDFYVIQCVGCGLVTAHWPDDQTLPYCACGYGFFAAGQHYTATRESGSPVGTLPPVRELSPAKPAAPLDSIPLPAPPISSAVVVPAVPILVARKVRVVAPLKSDPWPWPERKTPPRRKPRPLLCYVCHDPVGVRNRSGDGLCPRHHAQAEEEREVEAWRDQALARTHKRLEMNIEKFVVESCSALSDRIVNVDVLPQETHSPQLVSDFNGPTLFGLGALVLPSARQQGKHRYLSRYEGFDDRFRLRI